jgi:hypothetical protein
MGCDECIAWCAARRLWSEIRYCSLKMCVLTKQWVFRLGDDVYIYIYMYTYNVYSPREKGSSSAVHRYIYVCVCVCV